MLLQFEVSNFASIRERVSLSLYANHAKEHENILNVFNKERILPSIGIYGANASGKTNIFRALTIAIRAVRKSANLQINSPTGFAFPFLFDNNSRNEPTTISFSFVKDGTRYDYGFKADNKTVYEEYLYKYTSQKPSLIFERKKINQYRYTNVLKNKLEAYESKNTDNKLFLATATAWNCQLTREAFMWFAESINTYSSLSFQTNKNYNYDYLAANINNKEVKEFLITFLKNADFNISNFDIESRIVEDLSQIQLPPGLTFDSDYIEQIKNSLKEFKISTHHNIIGNNGLTKDYLLDIEYESEGTKIMLAYGPIIFDTLNKGKTLVIDEINNSLHPILVKYLIDMFHNKEFNRKEAQLIFTTHDAYVLDLDIFRRDQIYFIEKDNSTGVSDLYSLADFSPRSEENVRKGYLQGRYGAIPIVNGGIGW